MGPGMKSILMTNVLARRVQTALAIAPNLAQSLFFFPPPSLSLSLSLSLSQVVTRSPKCVSMRRKMAKAVDGCW